MKKILLIIALVSTFSVNGIAQAKIGHINSQEILSMLPERTSAEQQAQAFVQQKQNLLQGMYSEYESLVNKLQTLPETATQTERTSLQNQLVEVQERIQNAEQTAQQEIAQNEQELLRPMLTKVQEAIDAVAKANGFAYVFDTGAGVVVYAGGGEDISPLVKAHLGL